MAWTNEETVPANSTMIIDRAPSYPMYGGGGMGNGLGWGGDSGWIIIFLLVLFGGFGNNGFGGNGNMMWPFFMGNTNTNNDVQRGFDQSAVINGINGVTAAVNGVNQGLCNGFANAEIAANGRQMANMQQAFNAQTAIGQQLNNMAATQASCCCENRLATANLTSTILSENCADRAAVSDGIRDVLTADTANTQTILNAVRGIYDQMCQDKIDAKNERIAELQQQLTMANLAASQGAQTAAIQAGQRNLANEIEQYVRPTPVPAYQVQNPNCCNYNYGGCGYGAA